MLATNLIVCWPFWLCFLSLHVLCLPVEILILENKECSLDIFSTYIATDTHTCKSDLVNGSNAKKVPWKVVKSRFFISQKFTQKNRER